MVLVIGLVQDCSNSTANAQELPQSCIKPLPYTGKSFLTEAKDPFILKVNTMASDDLVTQGSRASSAIVLTWFLWNIPISTQEGLTKSFLGKWMIS